MPRLYKPEIYWDVIEIWANTLTWQDHAASEQKTKTPRGEMLNYRLFGRLFPKYDVDKGFIWHFQGIKLVRLLSDRLHTIDTKLKINYCLLRLLRANPWNFYWGRLLLISPLFGTGTEGPKNEIFYVLLAAKYPIYWTLTEW